MHPTPLTIGDAAKRIADKHKQPVDAWQIRRVITRGLLAEPAERRALFPFRRRRPTRVGGRPQGRRLSPLGRYCRCSLESPDHPAATERRRLSPTTALLVPLVRALAAMLLGVAQRRAERLKAGEATAAK